MSENNETNAPEQEQMVELQNEQDQGAEASETSDAVSTVQLGGLFAFKKGMSSVYDEAGKTIPVTVLKYEPWIVSQVKTPEKDGYSAIQVAALPKKAKNCTQSERAHLAAAGFENGAQLVREIRQDLPEGIKVGQRVQIESVAAGDTVQVVANSKGRGFSGGMKRWGFGGGPASHGSKFHRRPGSIGNRIWPGRVMPGRKMAGQYGDVQVSVKNVKVIDVIPEENVILVKGPIPGARNNLVQLMKA